MLRPTMMLAFALFSTTACTKKPQSRELQPVASDMLNDGMGNFNIEVGMRRLTAEQVEVQVDLSAVGIDQTDKIVVSVNTDGFVIMDGNRDWTGFVRPREHYRHKVSFKLLDDTERARATVAVRRSVDSELLWETTLEFIGTESGLEVMNP